MVQLIVSSCPSLHTEFLMPLLGYILCAPWEVTALLWCWQESGIPSLDTAKAGGRGVREEVSVVRECWMRCWRTPGTLAGWKCCVRWVRGGRQEGAPVPDVPAQPREVAQGRTEVLPNGKLDVPKGTLQSSWQWHCWDNALSLPIFLHFVFSNPHLMSTGYFSCTSIPTLITFLCVPVFKTSVWLPPKNRDFPKTLTWSCCPHLTLAGYFSLN